MVYKGEIERSKDQISASQEEWKSISMEFQKFREESELHERELKEEMSTKEAAMEEAMQVAMSEHLKEQQDQIEGLRAVLKEKEKESRRKVDEEKSQVGLVQNNLAAEVMQLQESLNTQQAEHRKFKTLASEEKVRLNSEVRALKAEVVNLTRVLHDAAQKKEEIESREARLKEDEQLLKETTMRLHGESEKATKRATEVEIAVQKGREDTALFQKELALTREENEALKLDREDLRQKLEQELSSSFNTELQIARGGKNGVGGEWKELENIEQEMESTKLTWENQQSLQHELGLAREEVLRLTKAMGEQTKLLEFVSTVKEDEVMELTTHVQNLEQLLTNADLELNGARHRIETDDADYRGHVKKQQEELETLAELLNTRTGERDEAVGRLMSQHDEVNGVFTQIQEQQEEMKSLSTLFSDQTRERDEATESLKTVTKERDDVREALTAVTEERDEALEKESKLIAALHGLHTDMSPVKRKSQATEGQLRVMEIERDGYEEQLTTARSRINELQEEASIRETEYTSLKVANDQFLVEIRDRDHILSQQRPYLTLPSRGPYNDWAGNFAQVQLETELKDLRANAGTASVELSKARHRVRELEAEVKASKRNAEKEVLKALEGQRMKQDLEKKQEMEEHAAERGLLQEELDAIKREAAWNQSEVANALMGKEVESLCAEVRKWGEDEIKKVQAEKEREKMQHEREVEELLASRQTLETDCHRNKHQAVLLQEEVRQWVEKSVRWKEEEAKLQQLMARQDSTASMHKELRDEFQEIKIQLEQALMEKKELSQQLAIATTEGGKPKSTAKFARGVWAQSGVSPKFWSPGEKRSPSNLDLGVSPSQSASPGVESDDEAPAGAESLNHDP